MQKRFIEALPFLAPTTETLDDFDVVDWTADEAAAVDFGPEDFVTVVVGLLGTVAVIVRDAGAVIGLEYDK